MAFTHHRPNLKGLPRTKRNNLSLAYDSFYLSLEAAYRRARTVEYYHENLRPVLLRLSGAVEAAVGDGPARIYSERGVVYQDSYLCRCLGVIGPARGIGAHKQG